MPNFQPQVNYNVPILQMEAPREIQRPDINVQTIDISHVLSSAMKLSAKNKAAEEAKDHERIMSEYASKYDAIQIALEQGAMRPMDADIAKRALSEESRQRGLTIKEDAKLREKYGAPVEQLQKEHLSNIVKENDEVAKAWRTEFRAMHPSYKDADVNTVDAFKRNIDMFAYSQDQLQAVVNDPYATKAEREAAYKNLTDSYADEAWLQVNTIVNDYMKKVSDTGDIDPDFEKKVFDSSVQTLMDRGLPQDMAVEMAQKAIDNSGLTMWETLNKTKTEDATKFANTYIENYNAAVKNVGAKATYNEVVGRGNTALGIVLSVDPQVAPYISRQTELDLNNAYMDVHETVVSRGLYGGEQKEVTKTLRPVDYKNVVKDVNINLAKSYVPDYVKSTKNATLLSQYNATTKDTQVKDMSPEDVDTFVKNSNAILAPSETPVSKNVRERMKNSDDTNEKAMGNFEEAEYIKAVDKKNAAALKQGLLKREAGDRIDALLSNYGDNVRVTKDGEVVLIKGGKLETIRRQFNSPESTVKALNDSLKNSFKDKDRIVGMLNAYNNEIKPLQPGEEIDDMKGFTIQGTFSKGLQKIEGLWKGSEDSDTIPLEREAFSQGVLDAAAELGGNIDEIPLERVKTSSQLLREEADRLEASVKRVQQSGAKTEKGKLERDMQKVAQARALADKLEQQMFTGEETKSTSKVSNKSTIGGASFVTNDAIVDNFIENKYSADKGYKESTRTDWKKDWKKLKTELHELIQNNKELFAHTNASEFERHLMNKWMTDRNSYEVRSIGAEQDAHAYLRVIKQNIETAKEWNKLWKDRPVEIWYDGIGKTLEDMEGLVDE